MNPSVQQEAISALSAQVAAILAEALAHRANLTERLILALYDHDTAQVRELADALKPAQQRTEIAAQNYQRQRTIVGVSDSAALREMEQLLQVLTSKALEAQTKLSRVLEEAGVAHPAQWLASTSQEVVVELLMREPWDARRDLVVLLGQGADRLVPALLQRGQARVFFQASKGERICGAQAFVSLEELESALWKLSLPHPGRFRLRQVGSKPLPLAKVTACLNQAMAAVTDFGDLFCQNASGLLSYCCRNLAAVAKTPSAHHLTGIFRGTPAIIVAAGPSLDKNIHLLHKLKGRALIIGINQTVRALLKAQVRPDIALACDHQNLGYHFAGTQPNEITALGLGASVSPDLFSIPANHVFTFAASPGIEGWIYQLMGEDASLRAGGTVSITALHLAVKMGCAPIIFVGQDLAIEGRKYYAQDAADGGSRLAMDADGKGLNMSTLTSKLRLAQSEEQARYFQEGMAKTLLLEDVAGFFGGTVQTTRAMRNQIYALRNQVHDLQAKVECINATEGGAFIEGMHHTRLAEVVERYAGHWVDVPAGLKAAFDQCDLAAREAKMRRGLCSVHENLLKAVGLAARCRMGKNKDGGAQQRLLGQLEKLVDELPFGQILQIAELYQAEVNGNSVSDQANLYGTFEKKGAELVPLFAGALKELKRF